MSKVPLYRVQTADGQDLSDLTLEEVRLFLAQEGTNVWPCGYVNYRKEDDRE